MAIVDVGILWGEAEQPGMTTAVRQAVVDFKNAESPPWDVNLRFADPSTGGIRQQELLKWTCESITSGNGIHGFIGPRGSTEAYHHSWIWEEHGIPTISPSATSPSLENQKFFSRTVPNDVYQARSLISIATKLGWDTAVILYEDSTYGTDLMLQLLSSGSSMGMLSFPLYENKTSMSQLLYTLEESVYHQVVIVVAQASLTIQFLTLAAERQVFNSGRLWIASESLVSTDANYSQLQPLKGLLSVQPISLSPYEGPLFDRTSYAAMYSMLMGLYNTSQILGIALDGSNRYTSANGCWKVSSSGQYRLGQTLMDLVQNSIKETEVLGYEITNLQQNRDSSKWSTVGNWLPNSGISLDLLRIQWPRGVRPLPQDILSGRQLSIIFPCNEEGLSFGTEYANSGGAYGKGVLWDIVEELRVLLGFQYTVNISCYNCNHENCVSGNTLQQIGKGEFNLFASALGVIPSREEYLDFPIPWTVDTKRLLIKTPKLDTVGIWRFLSPMQPEVYFATFGVVVVSAVGLWLTDFHVDPLLPRNLYSSFAEQAYLAYTTLFGVPVAFPYSQSGRVLMAGLIVYSVLFLATYTAEMTTFLTQRIPEYPLDGFTDFISGDVEIRQLGVEKDSATDHLLQNLGYSGYSYVDIYTDGYIKVKSGSLIAYLDSTLYSPYSKELTSECSLQFRGPEIQSLQLFKAFALPKNSPYTTTINDAFTTLLDTRKINEIKDRYVLPSCSTARESHNQMTLEAMLGPIYIFVAALSLALVLRFYVTVRRRVVSCRESVCEMQDKIEAHLRTLSSGSLEQIADIVVPNANAHFGYERRIEVTSRILSDVFGGRSDLPAASCVEVAQSMNLKDIDSINEKSEFIERIQNWLCEKEEDLEEQNKVFDIPVVTIPNRSLSLTGKFSKGDSTHRTRQSLNSTHRSLNTTRRRYSAGTPGRHTPRIGTPGRHTPRIGTPGRHTPRIATPRLSLNTVQHNCPDQV